MLYEKPYHHPYIPRSSRLAPEPPYVGGELSSLTSNTPFYRGQGIPIYPHTQSVRHVNFGSPNYGAAITVGLKRRDQGAAVEALQTQLKALGYDIGTHGVDGDFYIDTEKALKKYQKDKGIAQTGKVDQETYDHLQGKKAGGTKGKAQAAGGKKADVGGGLTKLFENIGAGFTATQTGQGGGGVTIQTYQQAGMSGATKALLGIGGAIALFGMVYLVAKD